MITIRYIQKEELEELRQLAIYVYQTTFEAVNTKENMVNYLAGAFNLHQVTTEFEETGSVLMAAFENDKMIGYLRLRKTTEVDAELGSSNIELQRLYVHPEYHGKGVANDLMTVSIEKARELGLTWLWLGVWEENVKAQRFYVRWGFEKFAEHVFWMGDDPQTDWLMKKKI